MGQSSYNINAEGTSILICEKIYIFEGGDKYGKDIC